MLGWNINIIAERKQGNNVLWAITYKVQAASLPHKGLHFKCDPIYMENTRIHCATFHSGLALKHTKHSTQQLMTRVS